MPKIIDRLFGQSHLVAAVAAVPKSRELARAEKALAAARADHEAARQEMADLSAGLKNAKTETGAAPGIKAAQRRLVEAEGRIRAARIARADVMPEYAAAVETAVREPVEQAAREILDALPAIRRGLNTIREAALVCGPAHIAELGAAPAYSTIMGIDTRGLQRLEDYANDLLKPSGVITREAAE